MAKHERNDSDDDQGPEPKVPRPSSGDDEPSEKPQTARAAKGKGLRSRAQQKPGNVVTANSKRHCTIHVLEQRESLSTEQVYADEDKTWLKKAEKTINALKYKTGLPKVTAVPTTDSSSMNQQFRTVEDLINGPIKDNRKFKPKITEKTAKQAGQDVEMWYFGADDGQQYRFLTRLGKTECDATTASSIAQDLTDVLNRWPGSLDTISVNEISNNYKRAKTIDHVMRAILRNYGHVSSHRPVSWVNKDSRLAFRVTVPLIDPSTYDHHDLEIDVSAKKVNGAHVPDDYKNVRFLKKLSGAPKAIPEYTSTQQTDGTFQHDDLVPKDLGKDESLRSQCEMAQTLARALVVRMEGMIITRKNAQTLYSDLLDLWGRPPTNQVPGAFGGYQLLHTSRNLRDRNILVLPSDMARACVTTKLPKFVVKSLDKARTLPINDAGTHTWTQTGDLKEAWLSVARAVHQVNTDIANGVPSSNQCFCSSKGMAESTAHHCGTCGRSVICSKLIMGVLGLRVCSHCSSEERKLSAGSAEAFLVGKFGHVYRQECKRLKENLTSQVNASIANDAISSIRSRFSGTSATWTDGYRQIEMSMPAESGVGKWVRSPNVPSIDAIFPYYPAAKGTVFRKHCVDNIEITSLALNYAKSIYPPAFLRMLRLNVLLANMWAEGTISEATFRQRQAGMLVHFESLRQVAIKANYQRVLRKRQGFNQERFDRDMDEWLSGRCRGGDGPWVKARYWSSKNTPTQQWTPATMQRIRSMIKQLEEEFNVSLPRGNIDDCPWFSIEPTMPDGWSWAVCYRIICERYDRMVEGCNGLDDTVDDPEDILIEIIFIACVILCTDLIDKFWTAEQKQKFKLQYSEMLDLPLTAIVWDPLCFAVTHRMHGSQMRTGWKKGATSLADRDDELNNLLLESRVSNLLKHNFEGDTYADLRKMLTEIELPAHCYHRERELLKIPDRLKDDFTQVSEDEGLDFEGAAADDFINDESDAEDAELSDVKSETDSDEEGDDDDDEDMAGIGSEASELKPEGDAGEGSPKGKGKGKVSAAVGLIDQDAMEEEVEAIIDDIADNYALLSTDNEVQRTLQYMKRLKDQDDRAGFDVARAELRDKFNI